MKNLAIGIPNLREIIEDGYAYVNKTMQVPKLLESAKIPLSLPTQTVRRVVAPLQLL